MSKYYRFEARFESHDVSNPHNPRHHRVISPLWSKDDPNDRWAALKHFTQTLDEVMLRYLVPIKSVRFSEVEDTTMESVLATGK